MFGLIAAMVALYVFDHRDPKHDSPPPKTATENPPAARRHAPPPKKQSAPKRGKKS